METCVGACVRVFAINRQKRRQCGSSGDSNKPILSRNCDKPEMDWNHTNNALTREALVRNTGCKAQCKKKKRSRVAVDVDHHHPAKDKPNSFHDTKTKRKTKNKHTHTGCNDHEAPLPPHARILQYVIPTHLPTFPFPRPQTHVRPSSEIYQARPSFEVLSRKKPATAVEANVLPSEH